MEQSENQVVRKLVNISSIISSDTIYRTYQEGKITYKEYLDIVYPERGSSEDKVANPMSYYNSQKKLKG